MKKILSILAVSISLFSFSQIKVKDLPTTTTGALGDFLIKDDVLGVPGSTKKISIASFLTTYFPSYFSGLLTTNYIPLATGAHTLGNSFLFQAGHNVKLTQSRYITSVDTTKAKIDLSNANTDGEILITSDGNTRAKGFVFCGSAASEIGYNLNGSGGNILFTSTAISLNNKNVGIGTTSPSAKLDLVGTLQYTDGNQGASKILTSDASGNATWQTAASGVSGLTSTYLPVATSSTTLGNSYLFQNTDGGAGIKLGAGKLLQDSSGASFINMYDGTGNIDIYANGADIILDSHTSCPSSFTTPEIDLGDTAASTGLLHFNNSSNSKQVTLRAGTTATNITYTLPITAPTTGQVLSSTNLGVMSWANAGSGTVTSVSGTTNRITSTGGATPVIDISASYVGQSSITTLGTVATGTWSATAIAATKGGTGQTTITTGDVLYGSASNVISKLGIGSSGQVLTVATGVPSWATPSSSGISLSAIGSSASANGATITGSTLNLEPASASFGGVVTTGTQTFAGTKTFANSGTPFKLSNTSATFPFLTATYTDKNNYSIIEGASTHASTAECAMIITNKVAVDSGATRPTILLIENTIGNSSVSKAKDYCGVALGSTDTIGATPDRGASSSWVSYGRQYTGTSSVGSYFAGKTKWELIGSDGVIYLTKGGGNDVPNLYVRASSDGLASSDANRLTLTNAGNFGLGPSTTPGSADPNSGYNIADFQGNNFLIGADIGLRTRTNSTTKNFYYTYANYTNANYPVCSFFGQSNSTNNYLFVGGGTGAYNSATYISFITAPNNSNGTSGVDRLTITSAGLIGIANTSPGSADPNAGNTIMDISGNTMILGADASSKNRTNSTTKTAFLTFANYTNTNYPTMALHCASNSTNNYLFIGGNTGAYNVPTDVQIATATAVTNATAGVTRLAINKNGLTTWTSAYQVLSAGTATAAQAPVKYTAGTLLGTIESLACEANAQGLYETSVALNRYAKGGVIKTFTADVNNSGTGETDLLTYTTKASTLAATGEELHFHCAGTFNDVTATAQIQFYFAGTNIGNTGALTVGSTGAWVADVYVMRTGSTTARADVNISTPTGSTAIYTSYTSLTGLTLSGTNIIKVTGTAGGATGGSDDITATKGKIAWTGADNN